jgi:hypothetical protein
VLSKTRVISVLFPSLRVAGSYLKVSVGIRADPDVRPRRRNDKQTKALQRLGRTNDLAVGIRITEPPAMALPANSRHRICDVSESRGCRGIDVLPRYGLSQLVLLKGGRGHSAGLGRGAERRVWTLELSPGNARDPLGKPPRRLEAPAVNQG